MQKLMKSFYKSSIITSMVLLVIGVLLLFKSEDTIIALSYILGTMLVILGIVAIFNFFKESSANLFNDLNIVYGFISIILGVLIIMNPTVIATFIPFVVGIAIFINSALKLTYSLEAKNNEDDIWKSSLVMAVISAVCGIIILFHPFQTSLAVFKLIGAFICIYAVLDIIYMLQIKNTVKMVKKAVERSAKEITNDVIEIKATDVKEKKTTPKKSTTTTKTPKKKATTTTKKTTTKTSTKKAPVKKSTTKKTTTKKADDKKTTPVKKKTTKTAAKKTTTRKKKEEK